MNTESKKKLHNLLGLKIESFYFQQGRYNQKFQDLKGYGTLTLITQLPSILEFFFFGKEDETGKEYHNLEIKEIDESRNKSWLPNYWQKVHPSAISMLGCEFTIKKISIYGENSDQIHDTDYLLIFESENNEQILVMADGVFDGEYRIGFDETEINNHFDLKREDGSDFYVLKQMIQ